DGFDVIVVGSRAYEGRPDLVTHNQRLLDYVRRGGTMIVQYNQYEYTEPGIAPYPVTMARPHDRVTDEAAEARVLQPEHPVFTTPNRITAEAFDGWVQERGLYFLNTWDEAFTPLLEMSDPDEEPKRGALLVADYGEGTYVYTGLALFRQLAAGVPGTTRLLANLLTRGAEWRRCPAMFGASTRAWEYESHCRLEPVILRTAGRLWSCRRSILCRQSC